MRFARLGLAISLVSGCDQVPGFSQSSSDEMVVETKYPEKVLWGDTHLHTANSLDAFGLGARLESEDALRFASGEEVTSTGGITAKLDRPLDFLVIADHAEGLGVTKTIYDAPRFLLRDPLLRRWHDLMHEGPEGSMKATVELIDRVSKKTLPASLTDPAKQKKNSQSIWRAHTKTVERYNNPGKFTAFIGFEYSLMPGGNNLHRVVMFRDNKEKADKVLPYSAQTGTSAAMLWDYMDSYEKITGGKLLAIPHNSNISNGLMFEMTKPGGGPMTAEDARRRAKREPLVEITQIKGDSEAHPFLSPNDEFASFGIDNWELGNLDMSEPKTNDMFAGEYVREALKRGLAIEAQTGVNPYKFGLIGSTDSHTALATSDEDNFFGKHSGNEPRAGRAVSPQDMGANKGRFGWHYLASGYAGVWAKANTRAAIFDAMIRREVYATTGPRMTVRFFGGWDFKVSDLARNWVAAGYARGVPMGANLRSKKGKAPSFIVSALKDPNGGNLDRAQVVKGWIDKSGKLHEQIFEVIWSDSESRQLVNGKLPSVGDTVNLATATYANTIGAPELTTVWTDPVFDAELNAFYYVRVLEIPTPTWPAYDAVRYRVKMPKSVKLKSQERAYTSPIWYIPKA
ncbi:DUF3604 domain-containing protein [Parasphingorhabdus sp.]|uniref:DUF3604 domain-containing protein n=1 Tax=Parasphingorhabdus sp. TaxID=2709688 RepID=UPI003C773F35